MVTTHFMDEAEQLCDRLVVMDAGRIAAEGSPQGLIYEHVRREVLEVRFGHGKNEEQVPSSTVSAAGSKCCPTGS